MSDGQKLKDAIEIYRKENKKLDEGLNRKETEIRQARQVAEAKSFHQD